MAAIDYLTLRSTLMYTSPGVLAPAGSIFTVSASGMQTMNTTVSSIGASTITVSTLQGSTLFGSTIVANGITLSTLTVSTINGALPGTGSGSSAALTSTMVSIGASTNQINNFSNGSFTTGWGSTLTGATSIKKVVLSNNGAIQTILQNSGSTMSTVITSLDSGITWTGSTMRGLPISGALPYQTYGSTINTMTVPGITAINAAASSGNQLAIASNELVYSSANSGATFTPTGFGQNNNPFIYIPFDGSVTDVMGNSVVTATATSGSISYVPGKVGTNAVNLNNSAAVGGTPSQYLRGTWTGASNFTFSGWFNAQTINGTQQMIYSAYQVAFMLLINTSNQLIAYTPSGGAASAIVIGTTSFTIAANTWYSFTIVYQAGGICSFYVNHALIGTTTNVGGTGTLTSTQYSLGTYDTSLGAAFSGYIDDFRIYNYAVTNPSGAALINPLVGPIMPFVYLTFDGSTTTDMMGNSTTTATGTMTPVVGQVGSNAVNLANTAGGTPNNFIRGTIPAMSSLTVSGWVNFQTIPASGNSPNTVFSIGTGSQTFLFLYYINGTGLQFQFLNSSSATITVGTQASISTGTWYNFTIIFNQTGTCHFYLNSTLIGSVAGEALLNTMTTYGIGSYTHASFGAFNGYVDDLRIYNGAFTPSQLSPVLYSPSYAIGSPNIYLPFENGSVLDVMGYSAISARGTMNFVPGVVGSTAVNLVNPVGGTAVNYIRGSWAGSPNFTVSFWFNAQALGVSQQVLFSAYTGNYVIYLNSSGQIIIYLPSGGTALNAITGPVISINTWYYLTAIFQTNGTCTLYVNNSLAASYTNSGGVSPYLTAAFAIGTYDNVIVSAFNGYIDDLKIYNCAVPFHALGPMNYTQTALSNSGAYQVVAAANGGVYTSANSGSTWSQATLASLQPAAAVNTVGGQLITPQLTNLVANTWTQNGVAWVASASSVLSSPALAAYGAFNNFVGSTGAYSWGSASGTYSTSSPFACTSAASTTILGIGATVGEWLQIQTSVPLVMQSYSYTCGGAVNIPKRYYIVGSNDGSTWYPIQLADMTTNPFNGNFQVASTYITVNQSGTQTIIGAQTGSGSFIIYSSTTNAYTYFRILATNVFGAGSLFELGEWYINFATPPTPLYVAPTAVTTVSGQVITPQLAGLAAATWTQNGVNWTASASTSFSQFFEGRNAFDTNYLNRWSSLSSTYTTTGNSSGISNTIIGIVGTQTGDWLQIQSSVPLVMSSYQFATGTGGPPRLPKTYYITGSNDGSNWYPLQYVSGGAATTTAITSLVPGVILINSTSTQTFGSSTVATTAYSTSTNAYTYFRLVCLTSYSSSGNWIELGEWLINFGTPSTALIANQSLNAITVMPQQTRLASNTWAQNGMSYVASASSIFTLGNSPYTAFSNNIGSGWANSVGNAYTSTGYSGAFSTTVLGSLGAVTGEWIQIQTSVPVVLSTYSYASSVTLIQLPQTYYIVGSTDGTNWYPIHYCSAMSRNPFTASVAPQTYLSVASSGSVTFIGNVTATGTFETYPTSSNAYTYFRFITRTIYSSSAAYVQISQIYYNFTAYTPSLLQSLSVSSTGQYMALAGAGATTPTLTGLATSTWTANGVNWTASASSFATTGYEPYRVYNNAYSGGSNGWASLGTYNASTGTYTGSVPTTIIGVNGGNPVLGEWIQIQSSVPLILQSYTYASYDTALQFAKTYYIVGSNDGSTWYPLQIVDYTSNPFTAGVTSLSSYITVNYTGSITVGAGSGTSFSYSTSTSSFLYFRMITTSIWAANIYTNLSIGELYLNFQSGPTFYSTNYGASWTRALSAATVTNANMLATSGNGQYSLQGYGQTVTLVSNILAGYSTGTYTTPTFSPVLSSAIGPVIAAALSETGQYMVILIQSATNNVYYSTNYGVSFTGLTVGSSPMVSCAISSIDGSYITVANTTQAYTLNRNIQGYSIAVGNQAGLINQAQNAIAIGNQAGLLNQSANSIILNASGSALNTNLSGFYVAPIANYASSSAASFSILGYGSDSQVVQTGMTALANGNVGIGTTNPGYALHVIGAIYASGNITALSDQRYKQNIVRLDRSLDILRRLNGYSYTRTDYQPGIRQIGLLAQEVNKVIPEAVSYDSSNDTYSLNYGCLIAPVIEAVKEINEKVDSRISELEAKLGAQQVLIQTLMDRSSTI